jgi:isopenicillin-N N-acyltransferase-like protein
VRQALRRKGGRIAIDDVKSALFDDFATPYAVCRPPHKDGPSHSISATVAMIVMEPALGRMQIAPMPALNRGFTTYTLDMEKGPRPD